MKNVLTLLFALSYICTQIPNPQAEFKFQFSCYRFIKSSFCSHIDVKMKCENCGEVQHVEQTVLPQKVLCFKCSDDNQKLPGNYEKGTAIGGGDCFFDSVAQGLRRLNTGMDFTVKSLRIVCKRFAQSQLETDQSWLEEALRDEVEPFKEYIKRIEFTAKDVQQKSEVVKELKLTKPIWGRSEIEGRIICKEYNVKLHVVEKHIVEEKEIWVDVIVDSEGSRSVDSVDYNEENTLHIINSGCGHFEPILGIQDNQKRSPDPSDYDDELTPEEELISIIKSRDSEGEKPAIKPKPDINCQNDGMDTPLHVVIPKNDLQDIKWLVQNGVRIDDIVQILQSHFQQLSVEEEQANQERNSEGNKIEDSDKKDQRSEQERHIPRSDKLPFDEDLKLSNSGDLSVVEALLTKNANVNVQTKDGFTSLHLAPLNGDADNVNKLLESSKVDTVAKTTNGNKTLHLATEKAHLNIVKALVENKADIDINNKDGNRASDLAHPEAKDYISSVFKRTKGAAGIEGQLCEINLTMLFLLKGITDDQITSFHLASNMEKADKFDDIVFKCEYTNQNSKTIFLQAKHKTDQKNININSLLSDSESGDFSLKKYFISYRKIKKEFSKKTESIFSGKFEDSNFFIYTNASFVGADNSIKEENIHNNDFLRISDLQSKYYQLEFNSNKKERIINLLKDSSDSKRLAKELVQSISSGKGIDMQKDIFQSYHTALQGKVIEKVEDKLEGKLSDKFLNDDGSLSMEDKEFRRVFLEEARRVFKKQGNELIQELQNKFIKLSNKFGINRGSENLELPNDPVDEDEIKDFLNKFKLFASQPSEQELEKVIKDILKDIYKVEQQDIDSVFSDVQYKVKNWWQSGNNYLGKDNKFFADALRVSINFGVKQPVTLFTGRREEISELHTRIQRSSEKVTVISQMTSISGLGGIGKTELARQYIYENSKDYDNNIIWVNAESEATLIESFSRLAKDKLKINTKDANGNEKDIKSIVEEIYKYFSKRKSLFIFDNAEKSEYLNKFLPLRSLTPDSKRPYILVTSRNREWETGIEVMDLNELKLEDAVEFVKKGLRIQDESQDEEVKALVEKLQCFPLAIQQAVAYIEDENVTGEFSIGDYLEEYKRKTEELLNSIVFKGIDNDYEKTTFTTWKITVDKIASEKEHGGTALEVLNTIAYLAPESIKREILLELAGHDERKLRSAVRLLVKYSMVNSKEKQRVLSVHRLVQEVTRLELKRQRKEEENLKLVLKLVKANLKKEHLDHAVSVWNHASKHKELVTNFSEFPAQITKELDYAGRYREACLFGTKALNGLERHDHADNLTLKSNIAHAFTNRRKYNEAFEMYQEVLNKRILTLANDHNDILNTQRDIAMVLANMERYNEALKIYQEVLEKRELILDSNYNDRQILHVMSDIGFVLRQQHKYDEALTIYQKVLEKRKLTLESNHNDILHTWHDIAEVLADQGKYNEALHIYQEVLEERRKLILGSNHNDSRILFLMIDIAAVLLKQHKYDEALTIFQEVLDNLKLIPDSMPNHNVILSAMGNIALVFGMLGKHDEALQILQEVLKKIKITVDSNHEDILSTQHKIGLVLIFQGKYNEALPIFQAVLCKTELTLASDHSYIFILQNNIAMALAHQGKYNDALQICQDVLKKRKLSRDRNHFDILSTMSDIALIRVGQRQYDEALQIYQEVFKETKLILGSNHSDVLTTQYFIGKVLACQRKYNEALRTFKEVLEKRKLILDRNHKDILTTENYIAMVEKLIMIRFIKKILKNKSDNGQ